MYPKHTPITIETTNAIFEGTLAEPLDSLDDVIPVLLDRDYADFPGQTVRFHGWMLSGDLGVDGLIYLEG